MRLEPLRLEVRSGGAVWSAPLSGDGALTVGPCEVDVQASAGASTWEWSVANAGRSHLALRSVALVFGVIDAAGPLRMFRHGYQSWSPSGVAVLGSDVDPSSIARFEFLDAVHHADQRPVDDAYELRSEWVTLLADATDALVLVGFLAGSEHDGTFRLRRVDGGPEVELVAEAFLGDAVVAAGSRLALHDLVVTPGQGGRSAAELLGGWAADAGRAGAARVDAPYQVGWCSWYQYFGAVTEATFLGNLAQGADWPFEVFQLDDGYQAAIGDWLRCAPSFPSGLERLAAAVAAAGRRPGIWLAPFLAAPDSRLAHEHPDWLARRPSAGGGDRAGDEPLFVWWNPDWQGGRDGFMYGLDTTNPEVLAHLETTARTLVDMGFTYLKLDFSFAPAVDGTWADPSRTPAQRVRAGYEAIRRGAGEDAFLLGCGVPLAPVVGLVDGNRIGPDVAPCWSLDPQEEIVPGYLDIQPGTAHAYAATMARSFQHRRLWLNDPDCVMLRATGTALDPEAARTWERVVGLSGGMCLVSDDLALLGSQERAALDETMALGRESDAAARAGDPAVVGDLLVRAPATELRAAGRTLITDPLSGSSSLRAVQSAP